MINPIGIQKHVGKKWTVVLAVLSFIIPLAVWSVVSYVPFVYHPLVKVVDAGGSMFCQPGDEIERANFEEENKTLLAAGEKMIAESLTDIPEGRVRDLTVERLKAIENGSRDFRF